MKKGFALIYVLVITVIMMITITSILTLGSSDIRQKNKVLATAGAYQMAQSGIEDAISRYRTNPTDSDLCSGEWFYFNVENNAYQRSNANFAPLTEAQGKYGFFATCTSPVTLGSVGYFKGSKIRLQADKGTDDTKWNIYQIGF